jgi:F0F1-type ATP synthase membrane subunit b/b'
MDLMPLILAGLITSLIFSILALILGINALILVKAMEKSTHTITYKPVDEEVDKHNQEFVKQWATDPAVLEKDKKKYNEDLEELMPELATSDEDKIVTSY